MKKDIKSKVMQYPLPVAMIRTYDEKGTPDVMNAAFAAPCSHVPPCIMVSINSAAKRKTLDNIRKKQAFVVQFAD